MRHRNRWYWNGRCGWRVAISSHESLNCNQLVYNAKIRKWNFACHGVELIEQYNDTGSILYDAPFVSVRASTYYYFTCLMSTVLHLTGDVVIR